MPIPASILKEAVASAKSISKPRSAPLITIFSRRKLQPRRNNAMPAVTTVRRRPRRPQLETATPLVAIAAAWQVIEEASLFLGVPLPMRYASGLAFRAKITFAHSPSFRRGFRQRADAGRERLYTYMRHWLAASLEEEHPALLAKLPVGYRTGQPLPAASPTPPRFSSPTLSNEARLLPAF